LLEYVFNARARINLLFFIPLKLFTAATFSGLVFYVRLRIVFVFLPTFWEFPNALGILVWDFRADDLLVSVEMKRSPGRDLYLQSHLIIL